jgi:hypothetical protein
MGKVKTTDFRGHFIMSGERNTKRFNLVARESPYEPSYKQEAFAFQNRVLGK